MKVRTGFVSNSSSSSFVVRLNKPIEEYDFSEFMEEYNISESEREFAEVLYKDLQDANVVDVDNDDIYISCECSRLPYDTMQKIEEKARAYVNKLIVKEQNKLLKGNIYKVEYADDCGEFYSDMEHDFMPSFKGTTQRISHH